MFDPAVIDISPSGRTIETSDHSGWAWSDLELIDASQGASVAERDALTLLAVLTRQIRDLFEAARVDRRSRRPGSAAPPAAIDEWVAAFTDKRRRSSTRVVVVGADANPACADGIKPPAGLSA